MVKCTEEDTFYHFKRDKNEVEMKRVGKKGMEVFKPYKPCEM